MSDKVLLKAAESGNYAVVRRILMNERAQGKFDPENYFTFLKWDHVMFIACQAGYDKIVRLLLKYDALSCKRTEDKKTSLILACEKGFEKTAFALIKSVSHGSFNDIDTSGRNALMHACCNGHSSIVEMLLKFGAYIHDRDIEGKNALLHACINGYENIVRQLIRHKIDINSQDKDGKTALMHASYQGHYGVVDILLKNNAYVKACDNAKLSAFYYACERGHREIVCLMVKFGVSPNSVVNRTGKSVLILACEREDFDMVEMLIQCGASLSHCDSMGRTALDYACLKHSLKIADILIMHGVKQQKFDYSWEKSLIYCSSNGQADMLKLFIKYGVPCLCNNSSSCRHSQWKTLFMNACSCGNLEVVKLLLSHEISLVDVNACSSNKKTAFIYACEEGRKDIVEYLVQQKGDVIDVDAVDINKKSALMYASQKGHDSVVFFMLKMMSRIDLNARDSMGRTALIHACQNGHERVVKVLTQHQVDIHVCDMRKKTALIRACEGGHIGIVQHLLICNGDFDQAQKRRALMYACNEGHEAIVEYLLKLGVDVSKTRFNKESVLTVAIRNGNSKIVNMLLEAGFSKIKYPEKHSPLIIACERGDEDTVKFLVEDRKVNLNVSDIYGKTPLMFACQNGCQPAVQILLKGGIDVNAQDSLGRSALYYAINYNGGHDRIVSLLLAHKDIIISGSSSNRAWTCCSHLIDACRLGNLKIVEQLIGHPSIDINACNFSNKNALMYACENGYDDIVNLLVQHNVYLNSVDQSLKTAMMYAWLNGYNSIMRLLIRPGIYLSVSPVMRGKTILMYAVESADEEMVRLLLNLDQNFGINETDCMYLKSAFLIACEKGFGNIVELMMTYYPDACCKSSDKMGKTGLMLACLRGRREVVDVLVKHCDVQFINASDYHSKTALNYVMAGLYQEIDIAFSLVKSGVDVNCRCGDGKTPLMYACWRGHEKLINRLLSYGADVNLQDSQGKSPLMVACQRGLIANGIVKQLIYNGADLHAEDQKGKTSLMYLCEKGFGEAVDLLIEKGVDVNRRDKERKTALMYTFKYGICNYNIACQLIQCGANVNAYDCTGKSVLMYAIENRSQQRCLGLLYKNGVNVNGGSVTKTKTAIMLACEKGNKIVVSSLKRKGADVDSFNFLGKTPLMFACEYGHLEIVKLLVRYGANIHVCNKRGQNAFMFACKRGHERIVKYLIKLKVDVQLKDKLGNTALMLAWKGRHHAVMKILIENEAEINWESNTFTLLMQTFENNDEKGVDILMLSGRLVEEFEADHNLLSEPFVQSAALGYHGIVDTFAHHKYEVDVLNDKGETALTVAFIAGHKEVVRCLLDWGADVDLKDIKGKTALMYACENGNVETTVILLKHKPDIDCLDDNGSTALMKACRKSNSEIVKLLLSHGARSDIKNKNGRNAISFCDCLWDMDMIQMIFKEKSFFLGDEEHRWLSESRRCAYLIVQHGDIACLVDMRDERKQTAFTFIASRGDENYFKKCLDHGASIDVTDIIGFSPFLYTLKGIGNTLQMLIETGQLSDNEGRLKCVYRNAMKEAWEQNKLLICPEAMEVLLKSGLFEWQLCPNRLLIPMGVEALKLGFCPGSNSNYSPLIGAMIDKNETAVQLFLENLYFLPEDLITLRTNRAVQLHINNPGLLVRIIRRGLELETMCLLSISKSISQGGLPCKRAERVDALPIPALFKEKLKFEQCRHLNSGNYYSRHW